MLDAQKSLLSEDPGSILYWSESYFETNILARKASAKQGKPAVVKKAHRQVYFPIHKSARKYLKNNDESPENEETNENIKFTNNEPISYKGGKTSSLTLCAAVTKKGVLMARTQYKQYTQIDLIEFFEELLQKLELEYPGKRFTFIDDNEGIYSGVMELFEKPQYKHHTYIPIPRYSSFFNAIKYLFNQLKQHVRGQQHKTLGKLVVSVHRAFEYVTPKNLLKYHKVAH
jgi:hypothetical protein